MTGRRPVLSLLKDVGDDADDDAAARAIREGRDAAARRIQFQRFQRWRVGGSRNGT